MRWELIEAQEVGGVLVQRSRCPVPGGWLVSTLTIVRAWNDGLMRWDVQSATESSVVVPDGCMRWGAEEGQR